MQTLVTKDVDLSGKTLVIELLGATLPITNKGYQKPLKIEFENIASAWKWYNKQFKVIVDEAKFQDDKYEGYRWIKSSDCTLIPLSDEEIERETERFDLVYNPAS